MTGLEILFAFLIAGVLAFFLSSVLGTSGPGPWGGLLIFFLILFLGIWAIGVWMRPVGPAIWGAYWLGFLWIGFIIMLLIAALSPSGRRIGRSAYTIPTGRNEATMSTAIGVLFWILLGVLLLSIIAALV